MRTFVITLIVALLCGMVLTGLAVVWGGPKPIAALDSINAPFKNLRMDNLPALTRYKARDGQTLAYRHYDADFTAMPSTAGRIVLVHGSSASSQSMHPVAQALALAGFTVDTLDIRGHGESGPHGDIAYIGQLEDDLADFMTAAPHAGHNTLLGFSAGGGFALRFAGGSQQQRFDRYVLLSPYLRHDAPTAKPMNDSWASVGIPRIIGLHLLNFLGISHWNDLRVVRFALNEVARKRLTDAYSYNLAINFAPHNDYQADIASAHAPITIVAGHDDELFYADRFKATFAQAGKTVNVTLVPKLGHISLTLEPTGVQAIVSACLSPEQ